MFRAALLAAHLLELSVMVCSYLIANRLVIIV